MAQDVWSNIQFDAHGNLVDVTRPTEPGPPPDRTWTCAELFALTSPLFGKVVATTDLDAITYNLVAASEIFIDDAGTWVRVVPYGQFVEWGSLAPDARSAVPPRARAVAAKTVWVSHEKPAERV